MAGPTSALQPPRATVLMPVFNGERWLAEAVESVLHQTLDEIELVVVDDGSTDGSRSILEHFGEIDQRVRVVTNETNRGISAALNQGWRIARSSYIARLDADDVALPDRISRQVSFLDAHPSVVAVGGAVVIIDDGGRQLSTIRYPTSSHAIRSALPRRNPLAHPAVTLRRSALELVGGYRLDHVEDYDLWLRLSGHFDLANLPDPVIKYRQHRGQVSLVALEEQSTRLLAVRAAARARRAGRPDPLDGTTRLTREVLESLGIGKREIESAVGRARLQRAASLAELGWHEESDLLVAQTTPISGRRAQKTAAAVTELLRAERLLDEGRALAGMTHVCLAVRHDPRYACGRASAWIYDRLRRGG